MQFIAHYKKLYPYVYPYRYRALLALLFSLPAGAMDAIIASFLRPYMDTVMIGKSVQEATYIPILIIVFSFCQSACNYAAVYFNTWVGSKVTLDLQTKVFKKIINNEATFFDKTTSGDIVQKCCNDVNTACSGFLTTLRLFATRLFSSMALVCVLLWNSWELSIIALTVLFGALYPLSQVRKKIKSIVTDNVNMLAKSYTIFNETFAGNKVIASYNLQEHQGKLFRHNMEKMFRLAMKMVQKTGILSPMMHFIVSFGIAGVIWFGSYLILNNYLTPGEFVSFIAALLMLYTPLKSMGTSVTSLHMSFMAMDRVTDVLERECTIQEKENAVELKEVKKSIKYDKVVFEYEKNKPVLKGVNLEIEVGKNIAFVGNSGGGKTSFVSLLPRFYDICSGSISIDGVDIRDYTLSSLRENISVVFQDNFLFGGTIRENIVLGKANATEEEINAAIKSACLDEFIASLENGIETEIGERGILLSGGQKQRIGIARAFIKNAPIVILDEATSALDNKSEAIVQEAITNLMKDRTVLIIAHRLSTIRNADKIVVVNHGEIVETGAHDELITKENSLYASLYKIGLEN